jgi:nitrate reductase gamma subunit
MTSGGDTVLQAALVGWIGLACVVFLVGCGWRAWKYGTAPEHLRWDLYPVAHEPGRDHGGSYLEEKDWWTKPRERSLWGEVSAMGSEIFLLKGVWENNRPVWWGSMPFHWGLYLLVLTTLGLLPAAVGLAPGPWLAVLGWTGAAGGALTALGAAILLVLRSTDRRLKPYTTPLDRMNLALLALLGVLSCGVAVGQGMGSVAGAVGRLLRAQPPEVSALLAAQMVVAATFLLYLPFTRMIHFFSKYFLYHQVRWDDRPVVQGTRLQRRLSAALNYGMTWSADHLQTGKTWAEVATTLPGGEEKGDS